MRTTVAVLAVLVAFVPALFCIAYAGETPEVTGTVNQNLETVAGVTDSEVVNREAEAISPDGFSVKELQQLRAGAETHQFQTEVNNMMRIIINSLYSNNEIFLREVISNGSDALDKVRFLSLTDPTQLESGAKLEIKVKADATAKTLTISDTGVGMTKEELVKNLGTIAQSGTADFFKNVAKSAGGENNLIGQFGVGFYSVYLVADRVTVASKSNNADKQYVWQSDASGTFTVSEDPRGNTLGRGTSITLHIKEDHTDYLDEAKLKAIVSKYSQFINFPIYLWTSKEVDKEVPLTEEEIQAEVEKAKAAKAEAEEDEEDEDEEEVKLEDTEEKEETEEDELANIPKTKSVKETVSEWELMNDTKPIWTRNSKDITDEEYNEFYKSFSKDSTDPLMKIHFVAEGEVEFKSLLYISGTPPSNLYDASTADAHKGIKLYVKRVFITDDFKEMLPKYLSFIKGVVDSDDLPLNVSREILQEHKILKVIRKKLVRKAIAMFQMLADEENQEKFLEFYKQYATSVKLGVIEDPANRNRLSQLLRFWSSKTGELTSLGDYVKRMKEGQTQIYYLAGESKDQVASSPLLERLVKKGYEVLYMIDPIDEYALGNLEKFDGKYPMTNIARENLKLDGEKEDEEKDKKDKEEYKVLTKFIKSTLDGKVVNVVVTKRLTSSPSVLVSGQSGWTANMERIIKAQALADPKSAANYAPRKILEINPRHPIVKELLRRVQEDEKGDETAKDIVGLLYDTAALTSGFTLDDAPSFATRIVKMMSLGLNVDPTAIEEEVEEEPAPEPEVVEAEDDIVDEPLPTKDEL
eukprot:TRINITY_DN30971_c0_g1_i1.p1 TRINITY_DN30971_c0_g1~~TRINITY_DN30971_c0_g1_i1.p1  ORF type:complete len:810 (-),score=442.35 TRINITY_DN30971_c0_g1_i1:500-2929(-)